MPTRLGRWLIIAGMLILVVACGLISFAFGHTTVGRAFLLMSVVGGVASVFPKARLRGVHPSIITILLTVAASGVAAWTFGWLDATWWEKVLLLALTTPPLKRMADAAYRSDIRRAQRRRNQLTADLVGRLRDGDEVEPCVLYLRPFAVTDRLPASYQSRLRRKAPVHLDLEILLERSLRNQRSFVALGRSAEMGEGAARVTTGDDDWRDIVQLLARQATFVAMVPLSRPGTMWELQWLAEQDLLGKTLFIMPETIDEIPSGVIYSVEKSDRIFDGDRRYDPAEHTLELSQEWFEAVRVARGFGLGLPPLADVGALFTLDPETRKVAKIVPLALSSLTNWGRPKYLRATLVHFGLIQSSSRPQLDLMREFRSAVFYSGQTLEYALIRAADGYIAWGETALGKDLICQAASEGSPRPQFVQAYLNSLPSLVDARLGLGDCDAAYHYLEFCRLLLVDRDLSWLTSKETDSNIATLIRSAEPHRSIDQELLRPRL